MHSSIGPVPASPSRVHLRADRGFSRHVRRVVFALRTLDRDRLTPGEAWIEDSAAYLMQEAAARAREAAALPPLPGRGNIPRVLILCRRAVREAGEEIGEADLLRAARAEEGDIEYEWAELGAFGAALGIALLEALREPLCACEANIRRQNIARRWAEDFAAQRRKELPEEETLLSAVLTRLSDLEVPDAPARADEALARRGLTADEVLRKARERDARKGLAVGRLIRSLQALPRLPLDRIAQRLSAAARVLRQEDTFRAMDAPSRGYYLQCTARLARRCGVPESAAAQAAMDLAADRQGVEGQAGYYLLHRPDLVRRALGRKAAVPSPRRKQGLFLLPLYAGAAVNAVLLMALGVPWPLVLPGTLCLSETLRSVYFALLRRMFPARMLPRLRFRRLPEDLRLLVAVPTLLSSRREAMQAARRLAALRCANPDPNIHWLLLSDFADSKTETDGGDADVLRAAEESVAALNARYGGGFFLLHRKRVWDEGQDCFMGRERKRGALEALNSLLTAGETEDVFAAATCDPASFQNRYAYVLTLDADAVLPPGEALRLAGVMEHPLQKGRLAVVQPRMETTPDTVKTRIQKWLGGGGGTDPYGLAAQDVYQDVPDAASFVGKGIYDPRLWSARLRDRLPAGRLLSHDLIEGEIAVCGRAGDVVLLDGHPASLAGWQKRLHRWTRGDWQLLPFLWNRRLSLLSRHKIWDNLRRSLVPAARLTLLLAGAAGSPGFWLPALPWPLRLSEISLLPGKALTCLDAAVRALYRQFVSKKKLLSWVTAAQADAGAWPSLGAVLFQIGAGVSSMALSLLPGGFVPGALLGALWAGGVLLIPFLDAPLRPRPMTPALRAAARKLARETWRFFEDAVGPDTRFLPPDNVQTDPDRGKALRTSPTNIGLYLLACCAARELGLITGKTMARRLTDTLDAVEQLDTWRGHLFNWYDLTDGAPLPPRFVSSVDSGNLAGCLLCCAQICRARLQEIPENLRALPRRLDALARGMDFSALYDQRRDLFFVGWNIDENRPSSAHYDLLASEARLLSFIAIAKGDAPARHWRRLGRAVTRAGGGAALLSWGGTMFEYLMPALLLPLIPGTLLGEGCRRAVRAQIAAAGSRPFGVSESGYYAFDPDMNYQYRAFGLPALALSPDTAGEVVSPYASLLALPFFPRAAGENLLRMRALGWADGHGFFEAADYAPGRVEAGPRLVKSHMAHHQGMILCALCNALEDGALIRAFMAPPDIRAWAPLLWERAPVSAPRRPGLPPPRRESAESGSLRRLARLGLPLDAQALAGGKTAWVVAGNGQGYLKWNDIMITRFDPQAGAASGPQLYVRDALTGAVCRPAARTGAVFEAGATRHQAALSDLDITLRCCVDPLSGMAVAALHLENRGALPREAEAVSFLEIAQSTQRDDAAHPNFRDLSVRVSPWGSRGLASRRLPRDEAERDIPTIYHAVAGDVAALCRQGDKTLFLGRTGTYARPEQLLSAPDQCAFRTGDVTAPCLSLRALTRLEPGGEAAVFFLTLPTFREPAEALFTPARALAAFSLAAQQARAALRSLRMTREDLFLCQQTLGAVLFTGQPHQARRSCAPRDALWRLSVSGDFPVVLARISPRPDLPLIRKLLLFHAWARRQGADIDLLFFCPEEGDYLRPCRDAVSALLSASPERALLGVPGGVHIASGDGQAADAAESLARLTLRSGLPLSAQLAALRLPPAAPAPFRLTSPEAITPPLLASFNGFGGFARDGAYWVLSPAPAPWHNILCGARFGTLVCENAILHSWAGNSRLDGLTLLPSDPRRPRPSEEIYLLDGEGRVYPLVGGAAVHAPGATEYRCLAGETESRLSVFAHAEQPMGVRSLTLKAPRGGAYQLWWLVRFAPGGNAEDVCLRPDGPLILARSNREDVLWAAMEEGRSRALAPAAAFGLQEETPPPALAAPPWDGGSVAVLRRDIALPPRQALRITLVLGTARDEAEAKALFSALLAEGAAEAERGVRGVWGRRLTALQLFSGDQPLERMMNTWLPYQLRAARLMARMGPYQPGGAVGFRDQLQDVMALLFTEPEIARAHILLCAAHQFPEGDVQHWWHAPARGVRTRISDDRLFLPWAAARYVAVTGDEAILQEEIPYLASAPLADGETERYESPGPTPYAETLLTHCCRALDSVQFGEHGLPLMGGGDWNDGMNRVGGESVWLGFFLALTLRDFAPLCEEARKERYLALRRTLLSLSDAAWTGKWYLRAWWADGRPLAGPDTAPPRIDLITQCFAVLAGAPRNKARDALRAAAERLYRRESGLVRLLDPPFTPEENAGYIGAYLPGVRENGGQYTHAVPWLILALREIGENALAWELARGLLPEARSDAPDKARRYRLEPYVLAGDIYAGENEGQGGWSWYTGSAGWLYIAVLTGLLGFEKRGDRARLRPCPRPDPQEFTLSLRFGSALYHFTAAPDVLFPTLDGVRLEDGWAPLLSDHRTHEARFPI